MSLIIGATPFSQWERLEPLFQQLDWSAQPVDPSALSGAVASSSNPCLLLHTRPELAIAQAIEQGASPDEAFGQWQAAAQSLLEVLRARRSQCLMVEVNSALKAPSQLLEWLKSNRPSLLKLPSVTTGFTEPLAGGEPPNEKALLLATQLVAQTPKVQSLLAPLEASTIPLSSGQYSVPVLDIERIGQQWQVTLQRQQPGSAVQGQQINDTQQKDVLNQLFKVQEELEKYHVQTKELKEHFRVASRDLSQAQKKLKSMESSPFWRITAPARLGLILAKKLLRKIKRFLARR